MKLRLFLSVLIVLHLAAVIAEPLRFFSRSSEKFAAEDTQMLRTLLGPYVDAMYLSHGYFFFAPNPGPSHLIEAEAVTPNQESTSLDRIRFPDRYEQWPRLLYHRHFMMTEFYHTIFAPSSLDQIESLPKEIQEQWKTDRQRFVAIQDSIKKNLEKKHPGKTFVLRRLQHELATPQSIFVDHWKLTDPRLFNVLEDSSRPPAQPSETVAPSPQPTPAKTEELIFP
jgi:hypothetical protein